MHTYSVKILIYAFSKNILDDSQFGIFDFKKTQKTMIHGDSHLGMLVETLNPNPN